MRALTASGLVARRGGFTLALDARFDAPFTAVLGASGAGKSTLLLAIGGFVRPDAGRVTLGDRVLSGPGAWVPPWERRVGTVFQKPNLWPHKRVRETIRYGGRYREDDVIGWCGLEGLLDRMPGGLSGGEAQRVAIARTVMARPEALLLDEPFTGLDPARRRELGTLLRRVQAELDIPVVCVTHEIPEALDLTDRLLLVAGGRRVAEGSLAELAAVDGVLELVGTLGLENRLEVEILGEEHGLTLAALGDARLLLPRSPLPVGARGVVAIRPEHVALGSAAIAGLSARNVLPGTVIALSAAAERVLVQVDVGQPVAAEVTPASVHELGLAPGAPVWVVAKTLAFRWRA
ncbi:MAG: ATP-binding cassette domain-containing protein [Deltaproteobacteria bacterium]|nr:ATP-binding cassette domain-containing protein [Deltaproteobacteria bacterium]